MSDQRWGNSCWTSAWGFGTIAGGYQPPCRVTCLHVCTLHDARAAHGLVNYAEVPVVPVAVTCCAALESLFKCFLMNHWDVPNLSEFSWKIFGRCHNYDLNARLLIPIKLEGEAPQPRLDGKASIKLRRMHRNIFGKGLKNVETTNQYDTV